jgi:hemoglobin
LQNSTVVAVLLGGTAAYAQQKTLYERLGGVFAIAAVVNHFSDAVVKNPIVGQRSKNPALREWHTKNLGRLPGLKFMRTLWVCNVAGGPFQYTATKPGSTPVGLEAAHRELKISPSEFDEWRPNLGERLTSSRCPLRRRKRF